MKYLFLSILFFIFIGCVPEERESIDCVSNAEVVDGTCQCIDGFHPEDGECFKNKKDINCKDIAPNNAKSDIKKEEITWDIEKESWNEPSNCEWSCNDNYKKEGERCVIDDLCLAKSCPDNSSCKIKDGIASCECNENFHDETGSCLSNSKSINCKDITPPENGRVVVEEVTIIWDSNTNSWSEPADCSWECVMGFQKIAQECVDLCLVNNISCEDNNPCTEDLCSAGRCNNQNLVDGTSCIGDICIENSTCSNGLCGGGSPISCDDNNPATTDSCNSLIGCVNRILDNTPCNDGELCTENDKYINEVCLGTPINCNNGICNSESGVCDCDPGYDGEFCDSSDPCSIITCQHGTQCVVGELDTPYCDCGMYPEYEGLECEIDINECERGTAQCGDSEYCINDIGGYTCEDCACNESGSETTYCEAGQCECTELYTGLKCNDCIAGYKKDGDECVNAIVINEVDPNENWVELYNSSTELIVLDGLVLNTDSSSASLNGLTIAPNDYLVVTINIDTMGDIVNLLIEEWDILVDETNFEETIPPTSSWGRYPNGVGEFSTVENITKNAMNVMIYNNVSAGANHGCALSTGKLYCWGQNSYGQLGDGDVNPSNLPEKISLYDDWSTLDLGNNHSCAIRSGILYCWGANSSGQLGLGGNTDVLIPTAVAFGSNWDKISLKNDHGCGIESGKLYCWGQNSSGQLGVGDQINKNLPTLVNSDTHWSYVSSGGNHSCAINSGELYCWGDNQYGQIGNGNYGTTKILNPTKVGGYNDWTKVSLGTSHTCGIRAGSLYCWGRNNGGQIGNGSKDQNIPVTMITQVGTKSNWQDISGGSSHTCGIESGKLYCWGYGMSGRLGLGDITEHFTPIQVGTDSDWTDVELGNDDSFAIKANFLYGWGSNLNHKLGIDSSLTSITEPFLSK